MSNATRQRAARVLRPRGPQRLCLLAALAVGGCREDLGECDAKAAREVVYSSTGLAATKGQALLHDSCGQGSFCHSAAAHGRNRRGVPNGLDFDVLPRPTSIGKVAELRERIWDTISAGEMPPKGFTVGDGHWSFDVERREGAATLQPLSTSAGKGVLRNWLACGAPTVDDSKVPAWATPSVQSTDPQASAWTSLHGELRSTCVSSGCHEGADADASTPGATSVPFVADECVVYRWLLFNRTDCGGRLVLGGDPDASALIRKMEDAQPSCGGPMPPAGPDGEKTVQAEKMSELIGHAREWIAQGASAPQCGEWSEAAPRVTGLDAGTQGEPASWQKVYADVLSPRCATAGCHDAKAKAGALDLSKICGAWSALRASGACGLRVSAGQPNDSSLYAKITAASCGASMPPGQTLPSVHVALIRAWIESGADGDECE